MSTPGYKGDTIAFGSFNHQVLTAKASFLRGDNSLGSGLPMTAAAGISVNFKQGALENTGNIWDLALVGDGFFTLEGPETEAMYTRNGRFGVDAEGYVVNDKGWYLLGQAGRITGDMRLDSSGNIINPDGEIVDKIQLVSFPNPQDLIRFSADFFTSPAQGEEASPDVMSGYLEASNIDLVNDLTDMMMLSRSFEMGQRLIQAQDKLLDLAANQLGSLRG